MSELLAQLEGSAYVVRRSLHNVANIRKAKKAILTAFKVQQAGLGFSMVELLSSCPTNWGDRARPSRCNGSRKIWFLTSRSATTK